MSFVISMYNDTRIEVARGWSSKTSEARSSKRDYIYRSLEKRDNSRGANGKISVETIHGERKGDRERFEGRLQREKHG